MPTLSKPGETQTFSWFVFGLMASVTFVGILSELVPSGILPQMTEGLDVEESEVGFLVGVYALASAIAAIPLISATLAFNRKTPIFDHAGRFNVWVAAITGMLSSLLGWFFGGIHFADSGPLLALHRWFGTATAAGLLSLLWVSERMQHGRANRFTFHVVLFVNSGLIAVTGFLGGAMVWGLDHYSW